MRCAITVGTYSLPQYAELQLRSLRRIFGDAPLLLCNGHSTFDEKIKAIADQFDAAFITERINRQHFQGCLMAALSSVAFAKANKCELAIKSNQRFLMLSPDIPNCLEAVFSDPKIDIAMPSPIREETIHSPKSRFHARFSVPPDFIAFRASAVDPEWIASAYSEQVRNSKSPADTMTETFWARAVENEFKGRFAPLPWLSEPSDPPMYLRKVQHKESEYQRAAIALGMAPASFPTGEWQEINRANYRPVPRM